MVKNPRKQGSEGYRGPVRAQQVLGGTLRMRFSLIPREMKFYDMFDEAASILTRAAGKFMSMVTEFNHLAERSQELKDEEHAADLVVGRIIKALDQSFITPFDR